MDLYDNKEQIISSDEYSDDYDDEDALMNEAVKAQSSASFRKAYSKSVCNNSKLTEQKSKQLSSLIRNKKIFIIYKNKAIKWLNNKKQRERLKVILYRNLPSQSVQIISNKHNGDNSLTKSGLPNDHDRNGLDNSAVRDKLTVREAVVTFGVNKTLRPELDEKEQVERGKRDRSLSPTPNDTSDAHKHTEKKFKIDTPQFYKKINEMFPKFDEILKGHIDCITNDTLKTTEEKMESIYTEIQTLNDIIRNKEAEWNRLIHLKMIKEEIYTRLTRKKTALQFEAEGNTKNHNKLSELKELELYLSDTQSIIMPNNSTNSSIQQIIEKRANMKPEDLQRESSGTSRLHSLLVSHKVLPSSDTSEFTFCNNGNISLSGKNVCLNTSEESYKLLGYRPLMKKNYQLDSKLINRNTDVRHRNNDISPRRKIFSSLQKTGIGQSFSQQFSAEDLAIKPITGAKKKDISLAFNNLMHEKNNINLNHSISAVNSKRDLKPSSPKFTQYPFCQHCNIHESRFVCAGCGNQWYCSRTCQISAWDKHSEVCTE